MYGTGAYYRTVEAFGLLEEQGNTVSPAQLHMAAQKYCRKVIHIFFHTEKKTVKLISIPRHYPD